jgi:RNA polymerase sigma-70 factor, ECF subfamily
LFFSIGGHRATDAAKTSPTAFGFAVAGDATAPQRGAAAARRDEFCRLIEKEIPFLRRTVRRWRRDGADADDLVQDTLVRALANGHLWQPGSDLRAWLFTIMRNQFYTALAKSHRSASALESFPAANPRSMLDPLEARLMLRDVDTALRRLPSSQRSAVRLVGIEGKSYEEVASIMGTSVGAVRCHLARARDRLRKALRGADVRPPFPQTLAAASPPILPGKGLHGIPSSLALAGAG